MNRGDDSELNWAIALRATHYPLKKSEKLMIFCVKLHFGILMPLPSGRLDAVLNCHRNYQNSKKTCYTTDSI